MRQHIIRLWFSIAAILPMAEMMAETHNVNLGTYAHGSVTAAPLSAEAGATVTLTISPDRGYQLETGSLMVERISTFENAEVRTRAPEGLGENVTVTGSGNGPYTFTMPDDDVRIYAAFEKIDYNVTIDVSQIRNGTVAADKTIAQLDDKVTLTVTSAAGYEMAELTVTDSDGNELDTQNEGSGKVSFQMPAGPVSVNATFSALPQNITKPNNEDIVGGTVSISPSQPNTDDMVSIMLKPDEGWQFVDLGLEPEDLETEVTNNADGTTTVTFPMPAGGVSINPTFEKKVLTPSLNEDVEGGSIASVIPAGPKVEDVVTVMLSPDNGWHPSGLTVTDGHGNAVTVTKDDDDANKYTFVQPATPVSITPVFEKTDYAVAIDASNIKNGTVSADKTTANIGDAITLSYTPDPGYALDVIVVKDAGGQELALTAAGEGKQTFSMPAGAVSVEATFKALPQVFNRPDNDDIEGGSVAINPTQPKTGEQVKVTLTPDEGWKYVELGLEPKGISVIKTENPDGSVTITFTMPAGGVTIDPVFEKINYPVQIDDSNIKNGSVSTDKTVAQLDDKVTLTVVSDSGYELDKVTVTDATGKALPLQNEGNGKISFKMPVGAVSVTAKFNALPQNITKPKNEDIIGGSVTINPENPKTGENATITLTPDAGWQFKNLGLEPEDLTVNTTVNPDNTVTVAFVMPAGGIKIDPVFEKIDYDVNINTENIKNGTVTSDKTKANVGDRITLTVSPNSGYEFESLTVKDEKGNIIPTTRDGDGRMTFEMPAGAITVEASFVEEKEEEVYLIDFPDSDDIKGGTMTVSPASPVPGETVTITLTPDEGWEFKDLGLWPSWISVNKKENHDNSVTFTFDMPYDDVTVNPRFELIDYQVVIDGTSILHGTVEADKLVAHIGDEIRLTVTPEDGYQLGELTVRDDKGAELTVSKINETTYSVRMPGGSIVVEAVFAAGSGINGILNAQGAKDDVWHGLNGQKLNAAPQRRGIYIRNGKKVLVAPK